MKTTKLTIRLSNEDLEFLREYAKRRKTTATAVVLRYLSRLKSAETFRRHEAVEKIAGLLPADLDVKEEYLAGILRKHR